MKLAMTLWLKGHQAHLWNGYGIAEMLGGELVY